jgi:phage terminase large subunit-like protein
MPMSETREKYYALIKKENDDILTEQELKNIAYELPLYVAEIVDSLLEQKQFQKANAYLKLWFEKEDFKLKFRGSQPLLMYEAVSPKHNQFQSFTSRIQFLQGANKTGKSCQGAKKIRDILWNELPGSPFNIQPGGEPFQIWVCNETRNLLKEAVIQLKKWLPEDSYKEVKGVKSLTDIINIDLPNGAKATITIMPYEAGVKAFESGNINLIWCDEPPPMDFFDAIWGRMVATRGWLLITATTIQADSQYLDQMIKGEGPKAEFFHQGLVQHARMGIWDNKNLSRREINEFIMSFPVNSPMYRARVLGEFAELEGLVFPNFMEFQIVDKQRINWNVYSPEEFTEKDKVKCARLDGADYGRDDPFALGNLYYAEDGTLYLDDLIYKSGLEARDQGRLINAKCNEHGKPIVTIADCQVLNNQAQGPSILAIWIDEIEEKNRSIFRCEMSDKKDPVGSLALLGDLITRINPKTGKPYFRIHMRCREAIQEFMNLAWKPHNASSTRQKEYTKGKDHVIAFMRYIVASGVLENGALYQQFQYEKGKIIELKKPKNKDPYLRPSDMKQDKKREIPYY